MLLFTTQPLFPWDALDDSPTCATIKHVRATIPDQSLLDSLRRHRGHGRDDCPLHVLWRGLLLTILLRHQNFAACLAELKRNNDLSVLIGLPRDDESAVPPAWNLSRFLDVLGQPPHLEHLPNPWAAPRTQGRRDCRSELRARLRISAAVSP